MGFFLYATGSFLKNPRAANSRLLVSKEMLCYDEAIKEAIGMRNVRCHDCGKRYNFDKDDFCPKCGAFTQPPHQTRIGMDGRVVRVDGINETNHTNSFVHAELHGENRERRGSDLERTRKSSALKKAELKSPLAKLHQQGTSLSDLGNMLGDMLGDFLKE